jgi:hypothetical protein
MAIYINFGVGTTPIIEKMHIYALIFKAIL